MSDRVRPVPRPAALDDYAGMWVAVIDGVVADAAPTSHALATQLMRMDHRRRARAVVEFVRPASEIYIVGVG